MHHFGDNCVTLLGRTYHYLMKCGDLTRNGLKYFTYDALHAKIALTEHSEALNQVEQRCNIEYLHSIYDELKEFNELVHDCQQIGYFARQYDTNPESFFSEEAIMDINEYTSGLDIAAITADNITGNQIIHYTIKGQGQQTSIPCYSKLQEPLLYPLLFPGNIFYVILIYHIKFFLIAGETGWSPDINKTVKFAKYICARILMPEPGLFWHFNDDRPSIPVNRFQLMARLGQTYIVGMLYSLF